MLDELHGRSNTEKEGCVLVQSKGMWLWWGLNCARSLKQLVILYLQLESRENEWPFACCLFFIWSRTPAHDISWLVFPLAINPGNPPKACSETSVASAVVILDSIKVIIKSTVAGCSMNILHYQLIATSLGVTTR